MLLLLSLCLCLLSFGVLGSSPFASFSSCCGCDPFCMIHNAAVSGVNCTNGRETYSYANTVFQYWNNIGASLQIKFPMHTGYYGYECYDISIDTSFPIEDIFSKTYSYYDNLDKICHRGGCCNLLHGKCSVGTTEFAYYNGIFMYSAPSSKLLIKGSFYESWIIEVSSTNMTSVMQLGYTYF
jgi:hypothetical protein